MKKVISIVTYDRGALDVYTNQMQTLFGDFVEINSYSLQDDLEAVIKRADLYLISTSAVEKNNSFIQQIPIGSETVEIAVDIPKAVIDELKVIPQGTKAMIVNISLFMTVETIAMLKQLEVHNIDFFPYYPNCEIVPDCDLAITPGAAQYVPSRAKKIIDIGHRIINAATIIEVALRLNLGFLLEQEKFREHFQSIGKGVYSFDKLYGNSILLGSRFDLLIQIMHDGIIGIDEDNIIFACNKNASNIININIPQIVGKNVNEILTCLSLEECPISKEAIVERLININDAAINISITPIIRRDKYIGAFIIMEKFIEEEKKQHKARLQLLNKGHKAKYTFEQIIGNSPPMIEAKSIAKKMAKTNSSILITGETGTGKELFAHAIHNASSRKEYPFIAINCAAMPETLLESELFGYEEGAFTGAKKGGKLGLFEFAHKGTIFLDEVEGMSSMLQIKLLRVLQEKEVMRIGGSKVISVDVRIIAATNESIEELIEKGTFRKDLYYRLNSLPIQIPPLRERVEDIILILENIKEKYGGMFELSKEVKDIFLNYSWNGNVRELQNYVEYFTYLDKAIIHVENLPPTFKNTKISKITQKKKEGAVDEIQKFYNFAGKRYDEYCFILKKLYESNQKQMRLGRKMLSQIALENNVYLTEQEVRSILLNLEMGGYVNILKGRGGSKITELGKRIIESGESG